MRDIKKPQGLGLFNEMLSLLELPLLFARTPRLMSLPRGNGERVIILPGFGAGDVSTLPLRHYLSRLGYQVSGWSGGTNNGEVLELIEQTRDLVEQEAADLQDKVTLIGWSLGGYIAREVARELPHCVRSVITMGSPVVGGPKYTLVAPVFEQRGMNLDEIERMVDERYDNPLTVPVTAIYSRNDGVVAWEACIDHRTPSVDHVEVRASHIGLGISAETFEVVATALAAES